MAAFAISFSAVASYALWGGSFDTITRQREAVVVWAALGLAFAFGLLPRSRLPRGGALVLGAFGLLALWVLVGLSWTESDERSSAELARVVHYSGVVALVWCAVGRGSWRGAAAGIVAGGVLVCGVAVGSRLFPDVLGQTEVPPELTRDRLSHPLDYWNAVAAWAAMTLAMCIAWSAHARSAPARAALLAAAPLCGLAVYLTYARGGAIAAVIAVLAAVALSRHRWVAAAHGLVAAGATGAAVLAVRAEPEIARATGDAGAAKVLLALLGGAAACALVAVALSAARADRLRMPRRAALASLGAALAMAAVVALTVASDPISEAWDEFRNNPVGPSADRADPAKRLTTASGTRYGLWSAALDSFAEDPVRGSGAGTFEFWWNRREGGEHVLDAHSLYLESLAELGLIGLVLVAGALLGMLALAMRARLRLERTSSVGAHAALTAAFVVFLFYAAVDWVWESTAVAVLALGCVAVAASARGAASVERPWIPRVGVAVAAVAAIVLQLPGIAATDAVRDSRDAFRDGDFDRAAERAQDAVDAEPWAASPYVQRGLVAEALGDLPSAEASLRSATEREPTNWRHWLLLARVEASLGETEPAIEHYRKARRLVKGSAFFP